LRPLTMVEDPVGRLWIGGSGPGALARVEPDGDGFEAWTPESPYDPTMLGQVDHLLVAPDGTLWLANAGSGLQQRDPGTGRVLRSVRGGPGLELPDGALESLVSGPSGGLWRRAASAWPCCLRAAVPSRRCRACPPATGSSRSRSPRPGNCGCSACPGSSSTG